VFNRIVFMAFHPHFANVVASVFAQSSARRVAFLGDQEVLTESGETEALDAFLSRVRAADFTVFEHPRQTSRINEMANWIFLDLSKARATDFADFDFIIDGGTLEHVGNMAAALAAVWTGLSQRGYFVGGYPVNNLCDHGYWLPQPRFFADFFRVNGAVDVDIRIVRFRGNDARASLELIPYRQGETGTMEQPHWAISKEQVGVFIIACKSDSLLYPAAVMPDEF
jgi:hypothetical protein